MISQKHVSRHSYSYDEKVTHYNYQCYQLGIDITKPVGNTGLLPSRNATQHSYFDGKATVYMCKRKQYESAARKKKKLFP